MTLISSNLMITLCIAFNKPFSKLLMPSEGILFVRPIVVRYRTVLHLSLNRITFTCCAISYASGNGLIWNRPEDIANNCMVLPLYEFAYASSY